ncbi:hypothetical protein M5689_012934 [Euphorbia peplus]|nr:hypothetical protein M5689_012934 [Euphorbia peplus]
MGNCQAAEAATVIIQHPANKKIQRVYWSVSAHEIMNANPGHYVALLVQSPTMKAQNGLPLKHLKLLRPDDTLLIGHVYRLVSFEDVLKEFASKKCVKLGKLLKERRSLEKSSSPDTSKSDTSSLLQEVEQESSTTTTTTTGGMGRKYLGHWKPALQSISEIGN